MTSGIAAGPMTSAWLLPLLRCPVCNGGLVFRALGGPDDGLLEHAGDGCDEGYPVIDEIPRLLVGPARAALARAKWEWFAKDGERRALAARWSAATGPDDPVVGAFDDEWRRHLRVGTPDQRDVFARYFDVVPRSCFARDLVVLDAGCGAGRWAYQVATQGPRVVAVDLGASIEVARANTPRDRVACVQADLRALPIAPASVDWAYSLGVLHHLGDAENTLAGIVASVKPGGRVLLYLYYALDARGPAYRGIFEAVDLLRRLLSRAPRALTRAVAAAIAALVYWPLARLGALMDSAGATAVADRLPLAFYRRLSFATMRNDSLDRFGTRIERRYTRADMATLMTRAGLGDVTISGSWPYWHAIGSRF